MPEIPLSHPAHGLTELDRLIILNIMRRPFDPDIARKTQLVVQVEAGNQAMQECGLDPARFAVALSPPDAVLLARAEVDLLSSCQNGCFGGWAAGELLLLILNFAEHAPEHASLNKAVHVLQDDLCNRKLRNGRTAPSSRSALLEAWRKFRPACHLLAAYNILVLQDCPPNPPDSRILPDFLQMLAVAEALAGRAEPVIDLSQRWRLPNGLALPPVQMSSPPITEWTKRVVATYPAELKRIRKKM